VTHVAVLGAGIMGSATALFLARRNVRVTLFDAADRPFTGASRWNEGKIHLGYLYAADPSLETARRILRGGLAFKALTEELIGCSLDAVVTPHDDTYVIHRDSVRDAGSTEQYFEEVAALVTSQGGAGYLVPITAARPRRLSSSELNAGYDTDLVVAGFRVPERSVSTCWVADRFVDALSAERRVEPRMATRVLAVRRSSDALDSTLLVETSDGPVGPFSHVVNALWEGRLGIDAGMGLPLPSSWSHRFRLSAFLRTSRSVDVASTVIATGPFGDIKNYNGRDFYLSWYLSGLVAEGTAVSPPRLSCLDAHDRTRISAEIVSRLARVVRSAATLSECTESLRLEGGWVYAAGQGSLADPTSTLHRRDRVGITQAGSYISVDTGKYSIAPWLAREIAGLIC
jgi:FAD dependent oxidoreductase